MDLGLFLLYLAACGGAAATGSFFMPDRWYRELQKPRWTPPDWAFPVAWSCLYLCMAAAAARVGPLPGAAHAMALWALQITVNALWSPVFFGLRRIRAAMWVVSLLWLAVAATTVAFLRLDLLAGLLFLPYLAWVTVAAALNLSVMRRNPGFA
jgi:tryptophan-rich sensory protein